MKKLLICLTASLFLCGSFTGCEKRIEADVQTEEKNEKNENKDIIGKWQNVEDGYTAEFTGQGTFIFDCGRGRIAVADYIIKDNVIRFDYRNVEISDNPWEFDCSEDKLVLTEINGKARNVYKRITAQDKVKPIDRKKDMAAVELGKPYTFWIFYSGKKCTKFSITFERLEITKKHPLNPKNVYLCNVNTPQASPGKKYIAIYTRIENLGPREQEFWTGGQEIKVNNGNIYSVKSVLVRNLKNPSSKMPIMGKNTFGIDYMEELMKQGDKGGWIFWSEIPKDTFPVEFLGVLGGGLFKEGTPIHMSLPKEHIKDLTLTDGKIALAQ